MKTLLISSLLAFSVAMSSTSFAHDNNIPIGKPEVPAKTQTIIRPVTNGKFDVVVGKTDGSLLIQVVDQQGRTLSSKPVYKQESATRIRFDLNELPDGIYEVVITEGSNRQVKDIVLNTHTSATYRTITLS